MIKINVIAVGKIKEKYFSEAIDEYLKRLKRFCEFNIVEVKEENFVKEPNDSEKLKILAKEGQLIQKELKGYVVTMAIEGDKLSSEQLSEKIKNLTSKGEGELTFVIGGSYGVDENVKKKSHALISMSKMTFPHTLARVMLVEQIYRAFMISSGGNYHK